MSRPGRRDVAGRSGRAASLVGDDTTQKATSTFRAMENSPSSRRRPRLEGVTHRATSVAISSGGASPLGSAEFLAEVEVDATAPPERATIQNRPRGVLPRRWGRG